MANINRTKAPLRAKKTIRQTGKGNKIVTVTINRRTKVRIRRS